MIFDRLGARHTRPRTTSGLTVVDDELSREKRLAHLLRFRTASRAAKARADRLELAHLVNEQMKKCRAPESKGPSR